MGPGKAVVDMSTVSPSASRELATRVRDTGAHGRRTGPGQRVTLKRASCRSWSAVTGRRSSGWSRLLELGPRVTHVGENGQAVPMKIAINLSLAVQMLAFSEGVLLAEKGGIARETAVGS